MVIVRWFEASIVPTSQGFFEAQHLKIWSQKLAHCLDVRTIQLLGQKDCVSLMARPAIICHSTWKGQRHGSEEIGQKIHGLFAGCCRWVLGYARAWSVRRKGSRVLDLFWESGLCEQECAALKASIADSRKMFGGKELCLLWNAMEWVL